MFPLIIAAGPVLASISTPEVAILASAYVAGKFINKKKTNKSN